MTPPGKLRVLHAPVNVAGGPGNLSHGLQDIGIDSSLLVFEDHRFGYPADHHLHLRSTGRRSDLAVNIPRQLRALAWAIPRFDIFHFHFGHMLAPKRIAFPVLRAARKTIVFQFWGSDIRDQPASSVSYLRHSDAAILGSFATLARAPELPADFPAYDVLPPAIDLSGWGVVTKESSSTVTIAHAPSSRAVKGTEAVIAAVDSLTSRGMDVTLDLIEGVSHEEARRRYESADIIVDQLRIGWHGLFAIESMALGKPVVCRIDRKAADRTGQQFGIDVPIVSATEEDLANTLLPLIESADRRAAIGRASRAYVEQVHDHRAVARRCAAIYERVRGT